MYHCYSFFNFISWRLMDDSSPLYILSHGKHQYYVAEICLKKTGEFMSLANMLWNLLEDVFSFSCNIVKYHRQHSHYKKYVLLNYVVPARTERYTSANERKGLTRDLEIILTTLREIKTHADIETVVCERHDQHASYKKMELSLREMKMELPSALTSFMQKFQTEQRMLTELNKSLETFYEENEP